MSLKSINLTKLLAAFGVSILSTSSALALEPNTSLVKYGESVASSSQKGAIKLHFVFKTTEAPLLAFRIDFTTTLKSLMAQQNANKDKAAYLMNVGKSELWQSKFCTSELKMIMNQFQINLVSGMLKNPAGEMQFLATCFKG